LIGIGRRTRTGKRQKLLLRRGNSVFEQHGDGHRADPAGDRSDVGSDLRHLVEGDVPHGLQFAVGAWDAVNAHVDDDGPRLDPVGLDESGYTGGGDQHIRPPGILLNSPGVLVARDDGGLQSHQHDGDGLADDVRSPHHDGGPALKFRAGGLDHAEYRQSGARSER